MNQKQLQEVFDVLCFLNKEHGQLEGIDVIEYSDRALKVVGGFFTSYDLREIQEKFGRVGFDDGLIVGYY